MLLQKYRNRNGRGIAILSGMGDSQRDSRESIRAAHSRLTPLFL